MLGESTEDDKCVIFCTIISPLVDYVGLINVTITFYTF
jgi:hypothetical protein